MGTLSEGVHELLYREALLLDEHRLEEWLELFTDDALYWIPATDETDPKRHVSLIHDDRRHLEDRVWRLTHEPGPSQQPPSRTSRMISNVLIDDLGDGSVVVRSRFVVYELRKGRDTVLPGAAEHRLVTGEDGKLRIAVKRVDLLHRGEPIHNLSIIL